MKIWVKLLYDCFFPSLQGTVMHPVPHAQPMLPVQQLSPVLCCSSLQCWLVLWYTTVIARGSPLWQKLASSSRNSQHQCMITLLDSLRTLNWGRMWHMALCAVKTTSNVILWNCSCQKMFIRYIGWRFFTSILITYTILYYLGMNLATNTVCIEMNIIK